MNDLLTKIQSYLTQTGLEAVLITRTDSFLGEYFPPYHNRLKSVTDGFSGSAGLALVSTHQNVLFVDSRYTEQARGQTMFQVYEVPTETTPTQWILGHFTDCKIGFNPGTHSYAWFKQMEELFLPRGIKLEPVPENIWAEWFGGDQFHQTDIFDYSIEYTGISAEEKRKRMGNFIRQKGWDAFVICSPENVSWLLNKRAQTVGEYPVIFERGYVDQNGVYSSLPDNMDTVFFNKRIGLDFSKTPFAICEKLQKIACVEEAKDPIDLWKACKNKVEINNIRQACLSESKTICRFLTWIEKNKESVDEVACGLKLKQLRAEDPLYFSDSFQTIAASGKHAALAHYTADTTSSWSIRQHPLLLVDTGGHYLNGTTDMTRTICVGVPTSLMKRRYTQVLKGHLALATSSIQSGESTRCLDEKAHQFLRADQVDYLHATSHGIGMMLGVHEMPPIVHAKDTQGLLAGMVFSNEPAYYSLSEGFGIRLENMLLAVQQEEKNLTFENLLFIPFDYRLIDFDLLTAVEKKALKFYHHQIREKVFPLLYSQEREILEPFITAYD